MFWELISFLEHVEALISLGTFVVAGIAALWVSQLRTANRRERARRQAPIEIILQGPADAPVSQQHCWTIPYTPPRSTLTRSELMGIVGMWVGSQRFDPKQVLTPMLENGSFEELITGDGAQLVLPWPEDPRSLATLDTATGTGDERKASESSLILATAKPSKPAVPLSPPIPSHHQHFQVAIESLSPQIHKLKIGFGPPADNSTIVAQAVQQMKELDGAGGELLLIDGPTSLPVAFVIAHSVAHRFSAVAVKDPKLQAYVVAISHAPAYPVGATFGEPSA